MGMKSHQYKDETEPAGVIPSDSLQLQRMENLDPNYFGFPPGICYM